jgi:hypothetical protein
MRLLFVIPHYFRNGPEEATQSTLKGKHTSTHSTAEARAEAVRKTVLSLHQTFGEAQAMIRHADRRTIAANQSTRHRIDVVIVTTSSHLIDEMSLPAGLFEHVELPSEPTCLGFQCHRQLEKRIDDYDFFGYLEDDLTMADPLFFQKLQWFNSCVGDDKLLLPNRFERSAGAAYKKCYIDGDLRQRATVRFQNRDEDRELRGSVMGQTIRFTRPLNPHAGCFFLNAVQMRAWVEQPHFGTTDSSFIGPLESAATLGIMRTFKIYKPAPVNAAFLEIEHNDDRFINLIRMQGG